MTQNKILWLRKCRHKILWLIYIKNSYFSYRYICSNDGVGVWLVLRKCPTKYQKFLKNKKDLLGEVIMNQFTYTVKSSIKRFRTTYLFKKNNGYGKIRSSYIGLIDAVKLFHFMTLKRRYGV